MRCRECGAFPISGTLCPSCKRLKRFAWQASGRTSSRQDSWESVVRTSSSTTIKIVIGGRRFDYSTQNGATPELLQQIAQETGISVSKAEELLNQAVQTSGVGENLSAGQAVAQGPLKKVKCPQCGRTIARTKGWCMYCGAELAEETTAPQTVREESSSRNSVADDVDARILKQDVPTGDAEEETRQEENTSYLDRLRNL